MSKREAEAEESEEESGSGETATETESEEESEEEEELQPWRHSIFGCCDHGVSQCCSLCWVGSCLYGNAITTTFHGGSGCCYFCCCAFGHLFCCCNRAKIRAKYGLEGHNLGACGECISATCCCCCFRWQMVLELETRQGRLYSTCGAARGDPRRQRANTGGGMSRAASRNQVLPVTAGGGTQSETQPLTGGGDGAGKGDDDDDSDPGLERSPSGRLIDTAPPRKAEEI